MGRSLRSMSPSDNQQADEDDRDCDVGVERDSGIVRGPVVRDDDLADVNDGVAELPHGVADYGGQPEVVAEPVAEDAEHTNGEVGDGDLGLEGVAGGPADRHCGGVRPDRVCEEVMTSSHSSRTSATWPAVRGCLSRSRWMAPMTRPRMKKNRNNMAAPRRRSASRRPATVGLFAAPPHRPCGL